MKSSASSKSAKNTASDMRRPFVMVVTLAGVLTLTSALLLALSRPPLAPEAASALYAIDAPTSMDVIFDTKIPPTSTRWKYIFIHHSATASGNATTLSENTGGLVDHFVIGNGDGCGDGEIQIGQRWNQQTAAGQLAGVKDMDPSCISICLVGDFDRTLPTPAQMRHLSQLVTTLQARLRIPSNSIIMVNQPNSAAAVGHYFPINAFSTQLLP